MKFCKQKFIKGLGDGTIYTLAFLFAAGAFSLAATIFGPVGIGIYLTFLCPVAYAFVEATQ